jgi:hypothetical protein
MAVSVVIVGDFYAENLSRCCFLGLHLQVLIFAVSVVIVAVFYAEKWTLEGVKQSPTKLVAFELVTVIFRQTPVLFTEDKDCTASHAVLLFH